MDLFKNDNDLKSFFKCSNLIKEFGVTSNFNIEHLELNHFLHTTDNIFKIRLDNGWLIQSIESNYKIKLAYSFVGEEWYCIYDLIKKSITHCCIQYERNAKTLDSIVFLEKILNLINQTDKIRLMRNKLDWEFSYFLNKIYPKILLENYFEPKQNDQELGGNFLLPELDYKQYEKVSLYYHQSIYNSVLTEKMNQRAMYNGVKWNEYIIFDFSELYKYGFNVISELEEHLTNHTYYSRLKNFLKIKFNIIMEIEIKYDSIILNFKN